MALQNDRRVILITGRAVFVDDNVVVRILHILQAVRLRKADTVVGDALGVARAVRNGAQLFKIVQRRIETLLSNISVIIPHFPEIVHANRLRESAEYGIIKL